MPETESCLTSFLHHCYTLLVKKHRTNIIFLERQMKRLEEESKKTGSSIAELVRRAVDAVYPEEKKAAAAKAR